MCSWKLKEENRDNGRKKIGDKIVDEKFFKNFKKLEFTDPGSMMNLRWYNFF